MRGKHKDAVDLAVAILRTFLFQTDLLNAMKMGTVAPLLIDLLDKRDSTATAVVALIAEYFAMYSLFHLNYKLKEIFKH